jgi:CRISPR-associated endonuclease Csn1
MGKVLGLDVGTNSLGWALVDTDKKEIIDMGVRVFQEGVNGLNTGKEESKNAERRTYRLTRRQYTRRKQRKSKLKSLLYSIGLFPKNEKELKEFWKLNPYTLRVKALDTELTSLELGRVLYHLNQRRGYQSNRKAQNEEEDKGTIYDGSKDSDKPGINVIKNALMSGQFRTLGEYLNSLDTTEQRIRNRFTSRNQYFDEFQQIWAKQKAYNPEILTEQNHYSIAKGCMFFQRPLKSQKKTLGHCTFEPKKYRAPKSQPISQEFRMYQLLNNLRIETKERVTDEQQELTGVEYDALLSYLKIHPSLELGRGKLKPELKKVFGLKKDDEYAFNYDKLLGLDTVSKIIKVVGDEYAVEKGDDFIHHIWHTLYFNEDPEKVKDYAIRKWDINEEQADKLKKIKLEAGYLNISTKAINNILPFLKEGYRYDESCSQAGYHHSQQHITTELLEFIPPVSDSDIRNPIVAVSLSQMRKVVNSIIREYGYTSEIHVELARDLKKPKQQRLDILKSNNDRAKQRSSIKSELEDYIDRPTKNDIRRYELWKEQHELCPYSGVKISLTRLTSGDSDIDVDHILPFSRTLDNSASNQVVCIREENAEKGNRTPWEAFSHNENKYYQICERVKSLPQNKRKRFLMTGEAFQKYLESDEGGDFIQRQLTDTAYIAKETMAVLKKVCPNVVATKGMATADLRHLWELNHVLGIKEKVNRDTGEVKVKKNRDDHRHHAVDALVIALTSRWSLQQLSNWNAGSSYSHRRDAARFTLTKPWDTLVEDTKNKISEIIVSHKTRKKIRGGLHEGTIYGRLRDSFTGELAFNESGAPLFKVRKPLFSLADSGQIQKIIDPVIRKLVLQRMIDHGADAKAISAGKKVSVPKNAFSEPLHMPKNNGSKGPKIRSVRIMVPGNKTFPVAENGERSHAFVEPGNNHHIVIFEREIRGKVERWSQVVSLFEVVKRRNRGEAPIMSSKEGWDFLYSLQANELFIPGITFLDEYNPTIHSVYRVQKLTDAQIALRKHSVAILDIKMADGSYYSPGRLLISPKQLKGLKVVISPIGKLEECHD